MNERKRSERERESLFVLPKHPPRKRLLCRLDPGILRVPVLDNTVTVSYACKRAPVPGITFVPVKLLHVHWFQIFAQLKAT